MSNQVNPHNPEDVEKSYLGVGWSFPPRFDELRRDVVMVAEEDDIRQSLHILLSTRPGERVMDPLFGCRLQESLYEPLTTTLKTYVKDLIYHAILDYEPRIKLEDVYMEESPDTEGLIHIYLDYTIRSTNTRTNMVYPFYREEATDL